LGVQRNFSGALLQWEDFAKHTAFRNLDRYYKRILSFNDDIQGTGAVALSALMTGIRAQKSSFRDQRFVIVGMGQAGSGVARNIRALLLEEGLSEEEARARIFALDMPGLLVEDTPGLEEQQLPYAQRRAALAGWKLDNPGHVTLDDVVRNAKPTALVGVTAQRGLFNGKILGELVKNAAHPIVMALSNPTSKSECTPEEVAAATGGRGLLATGSPFPPLKWEKRTILTSQCNNLYIFPGLGLGALVSHSPRITGRMFLAASKAISGMVSKTQEANGLLLPEMEAIRNVSVAVAKAVAIEARDSGLGRMMDDDEYERVIRKAQWQPRYSPYRPG
ncbi:MAG TPA: oxaloacetate-decarboxylating malate dehydrogenase, partial [Thermoanaerobaculia bacterium]